jgi:hypothetical protein
VTILFEEIVVALILVMPNDLSDYSLARRFVSVVENDSHMLAECIQGRWFLEHGRPTQKSGAGRVHRRNSIENSAMVQTLLPEPWAA